MRVMQTTEIFSGRLGMDEEGGHLIARFVELVECKQPVSNVSKSRTRVLSRSLCGECALSGRQAGRQARREGRDGGRVVTVGQGRKEGTAAAFFGLLPSRKSKQTSKQAWSSPPIITGSTNSASHIVHHHSPHVLPIFSQMLQSFP